MPEPITGTPAPANNPQGTGPTPEQPLQAVPTPAPVAIPAAPAATTPPPEVAALQQQLEQANKAARHYQSQFSQARNQLQAVTGVTPQADPYAEDIAYLKSKGYTEDNARDMAEFMGRKLQPFQQRIQQQEQIIRGSAQVEAVMQAAMQKDPTLFQDEQIYRQTFENLRQTALSGDTTYLNPDYAISYGEGVWGSIHRRAQMQPPNTPSPAAPAFTPRPMNFGGPPPGYTPAAPNTRVPDPEVQRYNDEIRNHFGLKAKQ